MKSVVIVSKYVHEVIDKDSSLKLYALENRSVFKVSPENMC